MAKSAATPEKVCVETVERGFVTRELAILISADRPWRNTQAFVAGPDENLKKTMA